MATSFELAQAGASLGDIDTTIRHPFRPSLKADAGNIDGLIDLYETLTNERNQLDSVIYSIRTMIQAASAGEKKTRRVQGERRRVKLEMPPDSWDQAALKTAWHDFPQHAERLLRIDRLSPRLREVAKLENTSGTRDFQVFRGIILGARREATRPATITIEE